MLCGDPAVTRAGAVGSGPWGLDEVELQDEPLELRKLIEECISARLRDVEKRLAALEKENPAEEVGGLGTFFPVQPQITTVTVPRLPFSRYDHLELSTAPNDNKDAASTAGDGGRCTAEYRFEACVWDSSVVVGLGILSWQESLSVVLCGFWSVLVEGFFVLILCDNMTDTVFEDSLAQEMSEWRMHFGQNLNHVDVTTGQPLIMGVCSMSNSLLNGVVQAEIYETMFKYGVREAGNDDLRWPLLPVGAWLALIALLVWIFTVIKDMICAFSFGFAMASLPLPGQQGSSQTVGSGRGSLQLLGMSRLRRLFLVLLNVLPRLSIALVLGIIGVQFLASTTSVSDLILNAVALEVVLCIDDLFFAVLVPRRVHEAVKSVKPITVKLKRPFLQARQGLIFLLSLASLVAAHVMYLQPVVDNMQRTADALCSGKTNFTSFQDAAGLVFVLEGDTPTRGGLGDLRSHDSYSYRAVLQAAGQATVPEASLAVQVHNAELWGLAMQLKSLNFEERNEFWPLCTDLDSPVYDGFGLLHMKSATIENLKHLFADLLEDDAEISCASLKSLCFNGSLPLGSLWHLRALCPVTCGCASLEGSFVANLPSFGCPQVCQSMFADALAMLPCTDRSEDDPIFTRYAHGLGERKGLTNHFSTCSDFSRPVTLDGSRFDFCNAEELQKMGFQSAQLVCPETCGCRELNRPSQCPSACVKSEASG